MKYLLLFMTFSFLLMSGCSFHWRAGINPPSANKSFVQASPTITPSVSSPIVKQVNQDELFEFYTGLVGYSSKKMIDSDKKIGELNLKIADNPKNAQLYFERGNIWFDLNKLQLAIGDYSLCIKLKPNYADAYKKRGNCYGMQNLHDKAARDFEIFAEKTNKPAEKHYYLTMALLSSGKIDNAMNEIEKLQPIIVSNEDKYFYFSGKGVVLQHKGNLAEALSCLKTALEFDSKDPKSYTNIAYICSLLKNPTESKKYADLCLSVYPYNSWAYLLKGNACEVMLNNDEAHICYAKALLINRDETAALMANSDLYRRQGEKDKALLFSKTACEVKPDSAAPFYINGLVLMDQGNKAEAKLSFEKAIRIEPNSNYARLSKEALEKM